MNITQLVRSLYKLYFLFFQPNIMKGCNILSIKNLSNNGLKAISIALDKECSCNIYWKLILGRVGHDKKRKKILKDSNLF